MKATEARAHAKKNAPIVAKQKRDAESREAAKERAENHAKRKKWRDKFSARVQGEIESAVRHGDNDCMVGISENTEYPYYFYRDERSFKEHFEYHDDLKLIMRKLKRDGYKVSIDTHSYEVDDRAAYLNSGGECGSDTVYWTSDVVLMVSWK